MLEGRAWLSIPMEEEVEMQINLKSLVLLTILLWSGNVAAQIRVSRWSLGASLTQTYLWGNGDSNTGYASITGIEPTLQYIVNNNLQIGYGYATTLTSYLTHRQTEPEEEANVGQMTSHSIIGHWLLDRRDRKVTHHLVLRISHLDYSHAGVYPDHFAGQQIVAGVSFDKPLGSRWHWRMLEVCPGLLFTDNPNFIPFSIYFGMGLTAQLRVQRK